jgi:hypothetical protein
MYGAVIPSYKSSDKGRKGKHERINADDPRNKDKVKAILFE